jgi:very-short-patch-repair endonuclease
LWAAIRGQRLGVEFRRQVPVMGRYVVDFLAPAARLIVEVDGEYHAQRRGADARRDAALRRAGYRVLRLEARRVVRQLSMALGRIVQELSALGNMA